MPYTSPTLLSTASLKKTVLQLFSSLPLSPAAYHLPPHSVNTNMSSRIRGRTLCMNILCGIPHNCMFKPTGSTGSVYICHAHTHTHFPSLSRTYTVTEQGSGAQCTVPEDLYTISHPSSRVSYFSALFSSHSVSFHKYYNTCINNFHGSHYKVKLFFPDSPQNCTSKVFNYYVWFAYWQFSRFPLSEPDLGPQGRGWCPSFFPQVMNRSWCPA